MWEGYRAAFAKLKACQDRVVDYNRTATNTADTVSQSLIHRCLVLTLCAFSSSSSLACLPC